MTSVLKLTRLGRRKDSLYTSVDKKIVLLSLILIAAIAKIFLIFVLPDKYLYDSNSIIYYSRSVLPNDKSYSFTAIFFTPFIYLFSIKTADKGSVILGIISNLILLFFFNRNLRKQVKCSDYLYLVCLTFLANIYVFNISKEFVTLLICLLAAFVIYKFKKLSNILVCALFIVFGIFFRSYFAIIGLLYLFLILVYKYIKSNLRMFVFLVVFIFGTLIVYFINETLFFDVFNFGVPVNVGREDSIDVQTLITPLLSNTNYFNALLNYIFSAFLLLFPFKLLLKFNILYYLFAFFSVYTLFILLKRRKARNVKVKQVIILLVSFFLVSVLFEPDYGSYLRHMTPLLLCECSYYAKIMSR